MSKIKRPNFMILDNDGVMRIEKEPLPGVPEFYAAQTRLGIRSVLLSNNSRVTSEGLVRQMQNFGVSDFTADQAMTSAEGTALFLREHPSTEDMSVFVVGGEGLHTAIDNEGISKANDNWDSSKMMWKDGNLPSDVVVGFHQSIDWHSEIAPAFNAIHGGARFIGTNSDQTYRGEYEILPANGSMLNYFSRVARRGEPIIVGKPNIGMAEAALHRMGAEKEAAKVAIVGDTLDQDMILAKNLRSAGWDVEGWLVLSGVDGRKNAEAPNARDLYGVDRIFEDIRDITRRLLEK
ncbi:HAD-IIA family hydrolase [Patescibacteria group bacterium]|nr:HAD-IIA family hydrolase [Patescibacteria group bacterium]